MMTRRRVQLILGMLWLLDGALQLQPFMLGRGFAREVIAPAGDGQPGWVASGVRWAAHLVAAAPVAWDVPFALVQLAIGVAMLFPRTVKVALLASLGWSAGVWFLGEGLGGLASGHADLLTGAPGAVLLYAVLAAAAWPVTSARGENASPAAWLPLAWAVVWVGGAVLRLLPGQNRTGDVVGAIHENADGAPSWLAHVDHWVASLLSGSGSAALLGLVAVQALIGFAAILPGAPRKAAGAVGIAVSAIFWVVGQSLGGLWTGQATDPNTAPVLMFMALAMMASPAAVPSLGRTGLSRDGREAGDPTTTASPSPTAQTHIRTVGPLPS